MLSSLILTAGLLTDTLLGEPKRFHPIIAFGKLASLLEQRLNDNIKTPSAQRLWGCVCWCLLVLPLPVFYHWQLSQLSITPLLDIIVLYLALALNSLKKHAMQVFTPLVQSNIEQAKRYCSYMVNRDTSSLNQQQISRAVTESVLENGHDAVIATLFWYLVGGAPLVILHRFSNTLDAMWGYKNLRFIYFGWCAARADDLLGWPSAKVTALLYALQGNVRASLKNSLIQSRDYKSLNGGWTIASGATVLNVQLGGSASYFGKTQAGTLLGQGTPPNPQHIEQSTRLVTRASILFCTLAIAVHILNITLIQ